MPLSNDGLRVLKAFTVSNPLARAYHAYINGQQDTTWSNPAYLADNHWAVTKSIVNVCRTIVEGHTCGLTFDIVDTDLTEDEKLELQVEQKSVDWETHSTGNGYLVGYFDRFGKKRLVSQKSENITPVYSEQYPEVEFFGKIWTSGKEESGAKNWHMEIYYDLEIQRFDTVNKSIGLPMQAPDWMWNEEGSGPHGFPENPVVPYKRGSRSRLDPGISALIDVLPIQDRNNKNNSDWTVTGDKAARTLIAVLEDPFIEEDEYENEEDKRGGVTEEVTGSTSAHNFLFLKGNSLSQIQAPSTEVFKTAREANYSDLSVVTGQPVSWLRGEAIENSSFGNTVFLSRRVWMQQKSYIQDNRLSMNKALRLLGKTGRFVYDVESLSLEAIANSAAS